MGSSWLSSIYSSGYHRFSARLSHLHNSRGTPLRNGGSSLVPYLDQLRDVATRRYADDESLQPETLADIGSIIQEFHNLDERSTTFRYALDKGGVPPLIEHDNIILDKLYYFMLPVSVWFAQMIERSNDLAPPSPGLELSWSKLM
jgi:hypothetical protein